MGRKARKTEAGALGRDPFATDDTILRETFFRPGEHGAIAPGGPIVEAAVAAKEPSWRVISISLYPEDIERIDALVAELRASGHRRANRSQLIRYAISLVDASKVPRGL